MNAVNYQKEFENIVSGFDSKKPTLLLHSCCAPCSSYCLVYLRKWFDITCFYYNPNITDQDEYIKRVAELHKLVEALSTEPIMIGGDEHGNSIIIENASPIDELGKISVIDGMYEPNLFFDEVKSKNLEREIEGGKRCEMCFNMRLSEAAKIASKGGFDYFTTSLTISPLKNAMLLNTIGENIASIYAGLKWLPSDFKKRNGYKLSTILSERYDLYRQDYCGCIYSQVERMNNRKDVL